MRYNDIRYDFNMLDHIFTTVGRCQKFFTLVDPLTISMDKQQECYAYDIFNTFFDIPVKNRE